EFRKTWATPADDAVAHDSRTALVFIGDISVLKEAGIEARLGTLLHSNAALPAGDEPAVRASVCATLSARRGEVWGCGVSEFYFWNENNDWRLLTSDQAETVVLARDDEAVVIRNATVERATAVSPDHWDHWTYSNTLMGGDASLYVEPPPSARPLNGSVRNALETQSFGRSEIEALLESDTGPREDLWSTAIEKARALNDWALAIQLHQRYRPMGRCSMDERPQQTAVRYADACYREGDLACFARLYVRIINNRFDSVAWSSYGDAAASTYAFELEKTGINAKRFLLGLVLHFGGDRPEQARLWRLGRAFAEAQLTGDAERLLTGWAQSESLDPYNRFRATVTLAGALHQQSKNPAEVAERVGRLSLTPHARQWVAQELGQ
ncbi:MAG: hypothetical protein AAFX94_00960, partial [Myxococcota bacterium]